ncbi:ead/Ea22-like family protein [Klebsiella michiganensis]|uniref:ead/Ea22-like family protein n=1 Tax=Klebsiella michiganensis TaxID=1134687 RepID=UPI003F60D6A5
MTDITKLALLVSKAKASVFTLEYISQFEPADIDSDDVDLRFEVDGRDTGTNVSIVDECGQAAKVIGTLVEALEYYKSREERVTSLVRDNSKSWDELYRQVEAKGKRNVELVEALASEKRICATWRKTAEANSEKLEKAQTINAAAEKLVRCKGRYHSEQNYRALAALFGVKTPDLPPLEHENVHYADAAEMEIEALRQRIAELEESNAQVIQSRDHYKRMTEEGLKQLAEARTVKLPDLRQIVSGDRYVWSDGVYNYSQDVKVALAAAGIKVEAE